MKRLLLPFLLCSLAKASTVMLQPSFNVSTGIPDNDPTGLAVTRTVSTSIDQVTAIEVGLEISSGWNGDLFVYLHHDGRTAILLNRPGRTSIVPDGSASSGFSVTFSDLAPLDIHVSIPDSGVATGLFQPDARAASPVTVIDTDPRTAWLDVFQGADPNGDWTLFVADLSPGDHSVLESWTLEIVGVPEVATPVLLGFSALLLGGRRKRC